jgi:hypothetical protein
VGWAVAVGCGVLLGRGVEVTVAVGNTVGVSVSDRRGARVGVGMIWRVTRISSRMTLVNPVKYASAARESRPIMMGMRYPLAFNGLKCKAARVMTPTSMANAR